MAAIIQARRGTAAQWIAANPILADGEFGHEKDTLKLKIGDGVTAWNSLDYLAMVATGGDASETSKGFVEEATDAEMLAGTAVGGTGAKLFVNPAKLLTLLSGITESRVAVAISGGTLTLDCLSYRQRNFDLTTTATGNFTIAITNATNLIRARLTLRVTGTITITMPSAVVMDSNEFYNGRWAYTTNILTVVGSSASPFMIEFVPDSAGNIFAFVTNSAL